MVLLCAPLGVYVLKLRANYGSSVYVEVQNVLEMSTSVMTEHDISAHSHNVRLAFTASFGKFT